MPRFEYQALSHHGDIVADELDGASAEAVIAELRARELLPVRVWEKSHGVSMWRGQWRIPGAHRIRSDELARFFRQLARLLTAGLPLDRALELLTRMTHKGRTRSPFSLILTRVRDGASLSEALAALPHDIPPIASALVRAGEASGALPGVLGRMADFMIRSEAIRQKLISAAIYPTILLVAALVSVGLILGFVLPEFEAVFRDAGAKPGFGAGLVLTAGQVLRDGWWVLFFGALPILMLVAWWTRRNPGLVQWRDRTVLRLPLIGGLVTRFEISRFCHSFAILLANGVPAAHAVPLAGATVSNLEFRAAIDRFTADFREGGGIATSLARAGRFPDLPLQLIQIGEETGRLADMLTEIAEIYDEEVERLLERLMAALVPAITIGIGLLVGLIVIGILTTMIGVTALVT